MCSFVRSALSLLMLVVLVPATAGMQDISSADLRVGWAEFKKAYDAKRILVVDVRGHEAYEAGHIPGSISVPLDDVGKRVEELRELGKPIVLYCA